MNVIPNRSINNNATKLTVIVILRECRDASRHSQELPKCEKQTAYIRELLDPLLHSHISVPGEAPYQWRNSL